MYKRYNSEVFVVMKKYILLPYSQYIEQFKGICNIGGGEVVGGGAGEPMSAML